jgi:hypothetical protein
MLSVYPFNRFLVWNVSGCWKCDFFKRNKFDWIILMIHRYLLNNRYQAIIQKKKQMKKEINSEFQRRRQISNKSSLLFPISEEVKCSWRWSHIQFQHHLVSILTYFHEFRFSNRGAHENGPITRPKIEKNGIIKKKRKEKKQKNFISYSS